MSPSPTIIPVMLTLPVNVTTLGDSMKTIQFRVVLPEKVGLVPPGILIFSNVLSVVVS